MSFKSMCRLCLTIEAPVHAIADTPLQEVYEKLTNISLYSSYKPVVACSLCYWQLRKCHKLMTRFIRADELLTKILQSGAWEKQDFISNINRETYKLDDGLSVSTMELNVFMASEYTIEHKIKVPLSHEKESEMTYASHIKIENLEDVEEPGLMDVNDVKTEEWTHEEYIVQEKIEVTEDIIEDLHEEETNDKLLEDGTPSMLYDAPRASLAGTQHTTTETCLHNVTDKYLSKTYICDDCGDTYSRKYLLKRHIEHYHHTKVEKNAEKKLYKCKICDKTYVLQQFFERHKKTHTEEDTSQSTICQKKFTHCGHFIKLLY